jgi:hypothetical protein
MIQVLEEGTSVQAFPLKILGYSVPLIILMALNSSQIIDCLIIQLFVTKISNMLEHLFFLACWFIHV